MIDIHLHGSLRDLVDPALLPLRLDVKSPGEAYLALRSQITGFQTAIDEGNWAWLVDDCETVTQEDVGLLLPAGASLHIYPVAEGSGFIIDFFLGVFSFIGSLFFPSIGDYGDRDHPEERASYLFNGPVNTREQGGVVPVVYGGPIEVGSYTISAGVSSARLTPARSGLPTGNIKGKAKEFENTLQTGATIRIVDLISEGEIEGLVDGARGVFINGVPVEDADGNEVAAVGTPEPTTDFHVPYGLGAGGYYRGAAAAPANANYKGITVDSRNGTADQTPLDGIPAIETERVVNRQVTRTTSIVEAVNAADVDAVRVTIRFPRLTQVTKKADTIPAMVTFAIDIQASGDADYTTALEQTIHDKNISPAEISYEINLKDRGDAPYNVRVRRISADSGSDRLHNQTWWARLTEIKEVRQSYPHSAVVGIVAEAEHFNGDIGKRKYNIKGKIVRVPSNYDPADRTYTGIWDGTFKRAWTDNGAWCVYDMLIHRRYGLGQDIEEEYLAATKWAFYTIAQFNDAAVNYTSASAPSDFNQDRFEFVQGKSEPRFTFTGVIQKAADAKKLIDNMLSNFHAAVYYGGGAVVPVQDSPADPEFLLTNSNVEDGDFHYSDLAYSERFSVVNVSFNDPADGYRLGIEQVFDRALITKYGYKVKDIVSMFNTSRGQARRHGLLYLFEQEHESDSASAIAGLDQATTRPGAVGRVADRLVAAARTGLRLVSINSAGTTLRLDDMADLATADDSGWTANVVLADGSVARKTVSSFKPADNTVVLDSALDPAPADGAVVVLEQTAVQARLWRAIGVKEQDEGLSYELALKAYHPDKYTSVETGVTVITPDYRLDGSERYTPLPALTSVTLTRSRIEGDAVLSDRLSISVVSADEQTYLVDYQVRGPYADGAESDALWSPLTRSPLRTLDVPGRLEPGTYRARARLVNDTLTARGPWVESGEVEVSDSALQAGLDGADGGEYEYVFCARDTAAAITGAANLPDPDWHFDIPGLATANGVTRGGYQYFDGTPANLGPDRPYVVRFKRRVQGFPAPDTDIGTVAWEQEPAYRQWGRGGLPGAGRILVYDDQESGSLTAAGQYKFSNAAAFAGLSITLPPRVKDAAYLYVHKSDAAGTDQSHYYDEVQAGDVVVWFDDNDFWMGWSITAKQKTGDVYRFALTFIESIDEAAHNLADGNVDLRFSRAPAGLDGADGGGYEYVFCATALGGTITGSANLPDPDWNFDIPGLATANGVTRGNNKYFDGEPNDVSAAKPFVHRFKRRVQGFPAANADIGTVAWEQEKAYRHWAEDGVGISSVSATNTGVKITTSDGTETNVPIKQVVDVSRDVDTGTVTVTYSDRSTDTFIVKDGSADLGALSIQRIYRRTTTPIRPNTATSTTTQRKTDNYTPAGASRRYTAPTASNPYAWVAYRYGVSGAWTNWTDWQANGFHASILASQTRSAETYPPVENTTGAWSNQIANNTTKGNNVITDMVTQYRDPDPDNDIAGWTETRYWDGTAWLVVDVKLSGNYFFDGAIGARKLDVENLSALNIKVVDADIEGTLSASKLVTDELIADVLNVDTLWSGNRTVSLTAGISSRTDTEAITLENAINRTEHTSILIIGQPDVFGLLPATGNRILRQADRAEIRATINATGTTVTLQARQTGSFGNAADAVSFTALSILGLKDNPEVVSEDAPGAPGNVAAAVGDYSSGTEQNDIRVTYTAPGDWGSGAANTREFEVRLFDSSDSQVGSTRTNSASTLTEDFTGLSNGTYYAQVRSKTEDGESAWQGTGNVTVNVQAVTYRLTLSPSSADIPEGGSQVFTANLSPAAPGNVTIDWALSGSGAGSDISFLSSGSRTSESTTISSGNTATTNRIYARDKDSSDAAALTVSATVAGQSLSDRSSLDVDDPAPVYSAIVTTGIGISPGASPGPNSVTPSWISGLVEQITRPGAPQGFYRSRQGSINVSDSDSAIDVKMVWGIKFADDDHSSHGNVALFMPTGTANNNTTFSRMVLTRGSSSLSFSRSSAEFNGAWREGGDTSATPARCRWLWRSPQDDDNDIFPYSTTGARVTVEFYR